MSKENQRAHYERCKEAGICPKCGQAVDKPDATYCLDCRDKRAQQKARRDAQRKQDQVCLDCGQAKEDVSKLHCKTCLDKRNQALGVRQEIFQAYGHECYCCQIADFEQLNLEATTSQALKIRQEWGAAFYLKLHQWAQHKGHYPSQFRLACKTCISSTIAVSKGDICLFHKKES